MKEKVINHLLLINPDEKIAKIISNKIKERQKISSGEVDLKDTTTYTR